MEEMLKILGKLRIEFQILSGLRMNKTELLGMQTLAAERSNHLMRPVHGVAGTPIEAR